MGWLDDDGNWVTGEKDAADKQRHQTAKAYMADSADRVDRPVEHAVAGKGGDETSKAARQVLELGRQGGDIDHISTLLALKRAAAADETDPGKLAATNREAVGELADDFDDVVEANHAEDDQDDRENFYYWLHDEYGWTEQDLALQLEQLNEQDQHKTIVMLRDLYAASGDDETGGDDEYADDDGDYEDYDEDDDTGYDTEGDADYATADGAEWQ